MIDYIKGELTELTPALAVVECHGVGYGVNISLNTYASIQGHKDVKLYIYEAIREDAFTLWGFSNKQERELFLLLISVSGIGGNTARMILSSLTTTELVDAISTDNAKLLKNVKGIGLKTAQRIIVDLKDKIIKTDVASQSNSLGLGEKNSISKEIQEEATSALTMLGFQASASQKVVVSILKEDPSASVEKVIKLALKQL
ncbi:MAG: Holliday junction branch migration protein RuvA [Bacteroidaceae bacterium]|jgi:Holliday junction DNA helicase RuvA|nr:Holliday junction branch migration protein RuvA [Bacteroidaceae bacterium]